MNMHEIVARGLGFLQTHQSVAGPLLCALGALETLPLVGAFAPLTASLIAVGAAIGGHVFDPWLLLWIMVGCAIGNGAAYEAGVLARRRDWATGWIPAKARSASERLFARFGAVAIILSRFLGVTASVAPFLAGWSNLGRLRFWAANLAVCLVWPPAMAAIGYSGLKALGGWLS
jgi:membrane-associated protein